MLGSVFVKGLVCLLGLSVVAAVGAQEQPRGVDFVSPEARLEKVFGRGVNTEGPAVAPDGSVYFVDAPVSTRTPRLADRIWRWDPATGVTAIYRSPSGMALGLKFDAANRLVAVEMSYGGGRRVTRTDLETGEAEIIADLYNGRPLGGLNDLAIDELGRIYVTEYDAIAPYEALYQRTPGIYRIDADGSIERVVQNAGLGNGIAISPDQRTLYVGAWRVDMFGNRALLAFDVDTAGSVSFREVLVRYGSDQGPDGMAMDVEGNVWVAVHSSTGRTGVAVYRPNGEEAAFIPTPEPAKNLAFGRGIARRTLYITAGQSLYRIQVLLDGYELPRPNERANDAAPVSFRPLISELQQGGSLSNERMQQSRRQNEQHPA
jgi:gluconolactonase